MTAYKTTVYVPQVSNHELLIRLYYGQTEISAKDIQQIFGVSSSTAQKLKARAREEMEAMGTPNWNPRMVNTEDALRSWGVDIVKIEKAAKKLRLNEKEAKPDE